MLFSFVADRYQYLASIGITTVVVAAAASGMTVILRTGVLRGRVGTALLIVLLLAVLGTLSWRHASLYRDGSRFFAHVVSYNPTARDAHLNLGSELLSRDRLDEALVAYRIAEEQRPEDCKPSYSAGLALHHLGRFEDAESAYLRALDMCPGYATALTDFAGMRLEQQHYEDALLLANTAIETQPRNAKAWVHRSRALQYLGEADQALGSIKRALAIDPTDQDAREMQAQIIGRWPTE